LKNNIVGLWTCKYKTTTTNGRAFKHTVYVTTRAADCGQGCEIETITVTLVEQIMKLAY
jgi:hypothetical protein